MNQTNILLHCSVGSSDKVYNITRIRASSARNDVFVEYGRRGSILKKDFKEIACSDSDADKTIATLLKEKTKKGYVVQNSNTSTIVNSATPPPSVASTAIPKCVLLNPIDKQQALALLEDEDWYMQEKKDGVRLQVEIKNCNIKAYNRNGKEIPLPQSITDDLLKLKKAWLLHTVLLDGEFLNDKYYVFDVILNDHFGCPFKNRLTSNIWSKTWTEIALSDNMDVVPATNDTGAKKAEFKRLQNKEGVVFKHKDANYYVGRPASGGDYLKYKFCESCTCVVITTSSKRSVGIGIMNNGDIQPIGNVTIPSNFEMPVCGTKVEVKYLYLHSLDGSLIQPVYMGERDDVDVDDIWSLKLKDSSNCPVDLSNLVKEVVALSERHGMSQMDAFNALKVFWDSKNVNYFGLEKLLP